MAERAELVCLSNTCAARVAVDGLLASRLDLSVARLVLARQTGWSFVRDHEGRWRPACRRCSAEGLRS